MAVPSIEKAIRGDVTQLERYRMRPSTPTTAALLVDTNGGRPPGSVAAPTPANIPALPPADPEAMGAVAKWMEHQTDAEGWAQVASKAPDPTGQIRLFAAIAAINARVSARNARDKTAWAPEA
jgi:hypothetical protein